MNGGSERAGDPVRPGPGDPGPAALALLAGSLAAPAATWPREAPSSLEAAVLALGRAHGVLPLVHEALASSPAHGWPGDLVDALRDETRTEAVAEAVHARALTSALAAMAAAGIGCLVFKGSALAYTLYHRPWLRPRDDTDLLVAPDDAPAAGAVLEGLGYTRTLGVSGERIAHQANFSRIAGMGVRVNLDLHWRVSNRARYASALEAGSLAARAVPLSALHPSARAPGPVDALLLACVHLHGHHRERPRLVWLHDVARLVAGLDAQQARQVAAEAAAGGLEQALGETLARTVEAFSVTLPAPLEALQAATAPGARGTTRLAHLWLEDLRALPDWRSRLGLLREHALPPAAYMLARYGTSRRVLLPALYLRRAVAGAVRLLRAAP